eukprot:1338989-Pleurochrysis_carterae.AAC.1
MPQLACACARSQPSTSSRGLTEQIRGWAVAIDRPIMRVWPGESRRKRGRAEPLMQSDTAIDGA